MEVIKATQLVFGYGAEPVIDGLNFSVNSGRIVGLLGKNGTGKSTLFNLLNGFLQPWSGTVELFGEKAGSLSFSTRKRIGYLNEGHVYYPFLSIAEAARMHALQNSGWQQESFDETVKLLGVKTSQTIGSLSCGQRSQVVLGLLMAQNFDLLILDDFSMGLDPGYRRLFIERLRAYSSQGEKTVFLTSHIVQDMEKLIDDVLIMGKHKFLYHSTLDTLLADNRFEPGSSLEDIFIHLTGLQE